LGLGTLATQSGTFSGTSSGTNTGDQTSIVGITGTKAQFNTAVTDGDIVYTDSLGTNVATFLATPTSANLAAALTDETGSGAAVFATSPTLVTPLLGTPTSGTLTNCTGYPSDWIKIQSQSASASSSINFTGLSSTYISYRIYITNLVPATDATSFYIRTSTDNGSTYDAAASDYAHARFFGTMISPSSIIAQGDDADNQIVVTGSVGNNTNEFISGYVDIFNPSAASYCSISFDFSGRLSDAAYYKFNGSGIRLAAANVDAIRFIMSSGNITSGTFILYGVRA
jgi:hypothetical protein